jgi:hypothetical protein
VEEPQQPYLQAIGSKQPRSEEEQLLKAMLVELATEEEIQATQPMKAAAETLATVL